MKKSAQIWYLIFLLPTIIESIDHKLPTISVGPLTIGRLGFILVGILLSFQYPMENYKSNIYRGLMIMVFGNLVSGILNNEMDSVTRTIAFGLLLTGARGMTALFSTKFGQYGLVLFFLSSFVYWGNYMVTNLFTGGVIVDYSSLFIEGEVVNHHFVGMNISMAGMFTSIFFFYKSGEMKLYGYFGIGIAAFACFLSESRSNTMITILGLILLLLMQRKNLTRQLIFLAPIVVLSVYLVGGLFQESDTLSRRFDVNDLDYQERTTGMRFDMIEIAFDELVKNPMGKGFKNIYISVAEKKANIHNQYLTFIIGGGILSLIGVVIWVMAVIKNMAYYLKQGNEEFKKDSFFTAIVITTTIFHITLLTLEFSTLLFFFIISLAIMIENRINKNIEFTAAVSRK